MTLAVPLHYHKCLVWLSCLETRSGTVNASKVYQGRVDTPILQNTKPTLVLASGHDVSEQATKFDARARK